MKANTDAKLHILQINFYTHIEGTKAFDVENTLD